MLIYRVKELQTDGFLIVQLGRLCVYVDFDFFFQIDFFKS